jgi:hypothetical protein
MYVILVKWVLNPGSRAPALTTATVYASGIGFQFFLWLILRALGV